MGSEKALYHNSGYERKLAELKRKPKEAAFNEIMEKLAMLAYFVGRDVRKFIEQKVPVFQHLYNGYFSDVGPDTVYTLLMEKTAKYSNMLHGLLAAEMKLMAALPGKGRDYILSYKEAMKKLTERQSSGYALDLLRQNMKMETITRIVTAKIWENIERREKEGVSQNTTRLMIKQFMSGFKTKENVQLIERLVAEANTQLGLLKLPAQYKEHEHTMIEALRESIKRSTGEDPDKVLAKAAVAQETVAEHKRQLGIDDYVRTLEAKAQNKEEKPKEETTESEEEENEPRSISELKKMGFKEISPKDLTLDKNGKLVIREEKPPQLLSMDEDTMQIKDAIPETFHEENTPREAKQEQQRIMRIGERDLKKCQEILEALETGQPMDDNPIYRSALRKSKKFQKIREEASGKPLDPILLKRVKGVNQECEPIFVEDVLTEEDDKQKFDLLSTKRKIRRSKHKKQTIFCSLTYITHFHMCNQQNVTLYTRFNMFQTFTEKLENDFII
eukprot:TRINITY_DN71002_c0_g1_i1.p1 TRINITY_DN71002_c0_g1~~TRINITY_DN71002_c0_g1_i1.p1  ORF type:complete len:502 (+),score=72.35 TRINITY_DN71002_c0_g1_i1:2670-4175(+)